MWQRIVSAFIYSFGRMNCADFTSWSTMVYCQTLTDACHSSWWTYGAEMTAHWSYPGTSCFTAICTQGIWLVAGNF